MFDISWSEFLLIGIVALVVIGPKELPGVMRTMGQWTRKLRGMASEFQSQFQEAMREAEMADLKQQVDDMAHDIKSYNPLKSVRDDIETAGKDIETSLREPAAPSAPPADAAADTAATLAAPVTPVESAPIAAVPETVPPPAGEAPMADAAEATKAADEPHDSERTG